MSVKVTLGKKEYFPGIEQIPYEGPDSKNILAFKYYDETIKDWQLEPGEFTIEVGSSSRDIRLKDNIDL